jgi:hypothetical protein
LQWLQEELRDEERERQWHKRRLSVILLYVGIVVGLYFRWFLNPIPPGYAVTALAVAAAIMAVVGELKGFEKVAWLVLLFAFAGLELRAIRQDKEAQDEIQRDYRYHQDLLTAQQLKNFRDIGSGIQTSIKKSDEHFEATTKKTNRVLTNITGGDSFAYVVPQDLTSDQSHGVVWNNGDQPLVGLTLTISHTSDPVSVWGEALYKPIFIGTIAPHDHAPIPDFIFQPRVRKDSGQDNYWIMLSAQNGTAQESLYFRKNKLHPQYWAYAFNIVRQHLDEKPQKEKILKEIDNTPRKGPRQELLLFRDWTDDMEERLLKKTKQHPAP